MCDKVAGLLSRQQEKDKAVLLGTSPFRASSRNYGCGRMVVAILTRHYTL